MVLRCSKHISVSFAIPKATFLAIPALSRQQNKLLMRHHGDFAAHGTFGGKRTACDRHQGRSLVFLEMAPTNHATEGNYINYKSLVSHKLCARASLQKSISMLSPISFSVASRMAMWIHEALETPGFEFEVLQFLTRND